MRPRRASPKRAISVASPMPTTEPIRNPARASRNEYHAARSTTTTIGVSDVRLSSSRSLLTIVQTWGIAVSLARGRIRTPSTAPPSSGPSALYSSHAPTTSATASTNNANLRITRRPPKASSSCAREQAGAARARSARRGPCPPAGSPLGEPGRGERGDDVLAVGLQGGVLAVVLQVDGELVHAETRE